MKRLVALFFTALMISVAPAVYAGPLHDAAAAGDVEKAAALLDGGADVNERQGYFRTPRGESPLTIAAFHGKIEMVKLLLDRGADINAAPDSWGPALCVAAEKGDTAMVDLLIERGADIGKAIIALEKRIAAYSPAILYQGQLRQCRNGIALLNQKNNPNTVGWANYNKGKYQEAVNSFKKAISLNPLDSYNFSGLSTAYVALNQNDEAVTAAKRAIELKPDNGVAYNNLGVAYNRQKKFGDSLAAFQKAIEIEPKNSLLYSNIGDLFFTMEEYARAIDNYKKAAELAPDNLGFLFSIAATCLKLGKYEDALAFANKAVDSQTITGVGVGFSVETGYPVVKNVMESGPASKAGIETGDKIIKVDGKSTKGWTEEKIRQGIRGAAGKPVALTIERKGTARPFEKIVTRETMMPAQAAGYLGLRSLINRYKENPEGASQDAEKAYSLDSANRWAQLSLGAVCLDRGKNEEALKLLSQSKGFITLARIFEAKAYAKLERMPEAVNTYLSIPEEEISPKDIPLMRERASLLQVFKPFTRARLDKAALLESKGRHQEALSEFSEALKTADETETADIQEAMFNIVGKNPELSEIPEAARRYAIRADVYLKDGKLEQAAAELKKAIQIAPYIAQLYKNSAVVNADLKKFPEAIRYMKVYIKADPYSPDIRAAKDEIIKWELAMENR